MDGSTIIITRSGMRTIPVSTKGNIKKDKKKHSKGDNMSLDKELMIESLQESLEKTNSSIEDLELKKEKIKKQITELRQGE